MLVNNKILIFLILLASACEVAAYGGKCFVSTHPSGIAVSFSMKEIDDGWSWFKNPRTDMYPEYQWVAEPGRVRSGRFVSDGAYISYAVGSFNAGAKYIKNGSIEDLLKDGWGSVNYKNRGMHSLLDSFDSKIFAARKLDSVVVVAASKEVRELLMNGKPTHFRMTYSSIDKKDNYVCIAQISG